VGVRQAKGEVGGGSLPLAKLPTWVVTVSTTKISASKLSGILRMGTPPLIVRIQRGQIWLDLRTLMDEEMSEVKKTIQNALQSRSIDGI